MSGFEPFPFHFLRPAWLVLLPVVAWLWWLVNTWQDPLRGWRAFMDRDLLDAMTVGRIGNPSYSNRWIGNPSLDRGLLATWLIAVVAIAGPTWRPEPSPFADDPVPVMLVLKAAESMNRTDFAPSRMDRARLKIADFAAERSGQPLGLIAYSGSAHLVLPPTRDTAVVASMAAEIDPAVMPRPGDDLAAALRLAARTLSDSGGSIVVLADETPWGRESDWRDLRSDDLLPVHFLAVARPDTPEWDGLSATAAALGASITRLTPDATDVLSLVRRTAKAPVAVAAAPEGTRWAEAGWWLVPVLALLSLATFRRARDADAEHDTLRARTGDEPTLEEPKETRG